MARAGRKRKQGRREPNGRLSRRRADVIDRTTREREMTETEAKSVVIEARVRHGIPRHLADLSDAGRPNAGTVHGLMRLRGELDADQWAAAEWWLGRRAEYLRGIDAPGRPCEASEVATGAGGVLFREAVAEWRPVVACLQEASIQTRSPVIAAFDVILVRQQYLPHLVGDLRIGLNALHRTFLAGERRAA